jgi:hypothetical protein
LSHQHTNNTYRQILSNEVPFNKPKIVNQLLHSSLSKSVIMTVIQLKTKPTDYLKSQPVLLQINLVTSKTKINNNYITRIWTNNQLPHNMRSTNSTHSIYSKDKMNENNMSQLTALINPYAKKSKEQTLLTTQLNEHNNSASTTQCDIDQIGTQYSEANNDRWTNIQFTKNLKPITHMNSTFTSPNPFTPLSDDESRESTPLKPAATNTIVDLNTQFSNNNTSSELTDTNNTNTRTTAHSESQPTRFQPESPLHTRAQPNNTRTKLSNENTVTFRDQKVSPVNDSKTNATPKNMSTTSINPS